MLDLDVRVWGGLTLLLLVLGAWLAALLALSSYQQQGATVRRDQCLGQAENADARDACRRVYERALDWN